MEKNGEIREGLTPPENPASGDKQASSDLASHVTTRIAETAKQGKEASAKLPANTDSARKDT